MFIKGFVLSLLLIAGNALAYDLHVDQDFQLDPSRIEVISASDALKQVGHYSFSFNEDVRYWDANDVLAINSFNIGLHCTLGDCQGRYNIYSTTVGVKSQVVSSYSWKPKSSRLVARLKTIFTDAKKRGLGVILKVDTLFDFDKVFFVQ